MQNQKQMITNNLFKFQNKCSGVNLLFITLFYVQSLQ